MRQPDVGEPRSQLQGAGILGDRLVERAGVAVVRPKGRVIVREAVRDDYRKAGLVGTTELMSRVEAVLRLVVAAERTEEHCPIEVRLDVARVQRNRPVE